MNMNKLFNAFSLACAGALLAACATTGGLSQAPVAPYREAVSLDGRLVVNYDKDGKPETLSGKFSWNQTADAVDVSLASPFGQTIAKIRVTPQEATLTQGERPPRVARDIDALTTQALGWSLPVSGLREWLQGYATAADGKRFAASPANNTIVTADGWRLTFVSWREGPGAPPAPKRIDAERVAAMAGGELALRIFIDEQG